MLVTDNIYYIKLGEGGEWESTSIKKGMLRFGYRETTHEFCLEERWDEVRNELSRIRNKDGVVTRDINQIKIFYHSTPDSIFITFHGGLLYWCRAQPEVTVANEDNARERLTLNGWSCRSLGGALLGTDKLSGSLVAVQGFQGTICRIKEREYLLRKLNDQPLPQSVEIDKIRTDYVRAAEALVRLLCWEDFELLVDLIFTRSGWSRLSSVGGTQKSVDFEISLPTTREIASVQVKSRADVNMLFDYIERFNASRKYHKLFFVWHTGNIDIGSLQRCPANVVLYNCRRISELVVDLGLVNWVRDKVN